MGLYSDTRNSGFMLEQNSFDGSASGFIQLCHPVRREKKFSVIRYLVTSVTLRDVIIKTLNP
jgi:hypothetical protein